MNQNVRTKKASIKPEKAYFINLGHGNQWASECLEEGVIKLGFQSGPQFERFQKSDWDDVLEYLKKEVHTNKPQAVASNSLRQIRSFFEADDKTLWITFQNGFLWWSISQPPPEKARDGSHAFLKTLDGWHKNDINGNPLTFDKLSGALLKARGYRGTICSVDVFEYLVRRINNQLSPEVQGAEDARVKMLKALEKIIEGLQWQELELLVDMIFSRSGWQRIGAVGKTQKTIDIELLMPVTGERAFAQIKSSANQKDFDSYLEEFRGHKESGAHEKMFFIYNQGKVADSSNENESVFVWDSEWLARKCLDSGLTEWLISKAH